MLLLTLMIILGLVLLGLCVGSFVNALVWRLHMQSEEEAVVSNLGSAKMKPKKQITENRLLKTGGRYSILNGRSMCVHCEHELAWYDLLPVLSWLSVKGKCRYCKKQISWQYPVVELATAILFVFSYLFWPLEVNGVQAVVFALWLVILTGLVALVVYDIRWMLLPNKIIFPLYGAAAAMVALRVYDSGDTQVLIQSLLGVVVGGGIFYVLFQLSRGKWIGGGDVKLGFLLGAVLGSVQLAFLMLFTASLLGTLFALPLMLRGGLSRSSRIPFGPFLIIATVLVMFYGTPVIDWYFNLLSY